MKTKTIDSMNRAENRKVLDCASPPAPSNWPPSPQKRQRTGPVQEAVAPTLFLPLALVGALSLFTHSTFAQTWQTVDDFQYAVGSRAVANGLAADAQGNIYAAGWGQDSSQAFHGLVMRSGDQGANWATVLDFNYLPSFDTSAFTALAFDSAQNLYAAGVAEDQNGTNNSHWLVVKSPDYGTTWATVMDVNFPSYADPQPIITPVIGPAYIAGDSSGNVFAVLGNIQDRGNYWVVRRSTDAGAHWTTVDTYTNGQVARAIVCAPSGIFVAGYRNGPWGVVRKSADGGLTWKTVDVYNYPIAKTQSFYGWGDGLTSMCLHPSGDLYAGGWATVGRKNGRSSTNYWVVRKGSNGGTSWQTVASFPVSINSGYVGGGVPATITALGTDRVGNLFAGGYAANSWLVLQSANQGAAWSTADNFQYSSLGAAAESFGRDSAGNLYFGGYANDAAGAMHWIVRKRAPQ